MAGGASRVRIQSGVRRTVAASPSPSAMVQEGAPSWWCACPDDNASLFGRLGSSRWMREARPTSPCHPHTPSRCMRHLADHRGGFLYAGRAGCAGSMAAGRAAKQRKRKNVRPTTSRICTVCQQERHSERLAQAATAAAANRDERRAAPQVKQVSASAATPNPR